MRALFERTDAPDGPFRHSTVAAALLATAVALALAVSCQAPIDQKKGYIGDFCNGPDDQCRQGLVCENGVCTSLNDAPNVCNTVCGKYSECELGIESCRPSCLKTLEEWSEENTSRYETCHEEVACETLQNRQAPWNYCYNQLPEAPESRLEKCNDLERKVKSCLDSADIEPKGRVQNMKSECRTEARTVGSDTWENNSRCAGQGECRVLLECANEFFELEDDDKLPTSPNEE